MSPPDICLPIEAIAYFPSLVKLLYHFHKIVLQLVGIVCVSKFPNIKRKMSGGVRIEIRETTEELTTLMKEEKDVLRHEKLQVLYWLKTKTVDSVLSAAVRLGKHRTTIQRWLSSYRKGGIEELLLQKPRSVRP
jgi:hypothetical protein